MVVRFVAFAGLLLLGTGSLALGHRGVVSAGTLKRGCRTFGDVKLCFSGGDSSLLVGGKKTSLLEVGWPKFLEYQVARDGGVFRVRIAKWSTSDMPFYRYGEVSFRQAQTRYLATKYVEASEMECPGQPDLRRIDEIDFRTRTITTVLEPAWTADRKGRRYVHPVRLGTSDIYKLSDASIADLIGSTPANRRLCKDYNG